MSIIPEILSPAGGMPQLEAGVRCGADAVYLGAQSMNARRSASNFDDGQLEQAVRYCHVRGVKVYLTMNTLLFDDEFAEAERLLSLACRVGVDALIVQDIGLASYIAKRAPGMPLHASTQCSIQTVSGLRALKDLGFRRAILARELSRGELEQLASSGIMELEYFVHGALCMSVSGQCWLSAMLGQRSGNRGRCAQPCRLPFRDGGYMCCLSLKDSTLMEHIPELARMGISSLKIEGRLKRPEYCAAVTDACVRARSGEKLSDEDTAKLAAVFSRSGFTDGYYIGVESPGNSRCGRRDMFGTRTKSDVEASDSATFADIHKLYKNERRSVPVDMELTVNEDGFELAVSDDSGSKVSARAEIPPANGTPSHGVSDRPDGCDNNISASEVSASARAKLERTGGTPYYVRSLKVSGRDASRLTPSAAGELRRNALEALTAERSRPHSVPMTGKAIGDDYKPEPHIMQYSRRLDIIFRSDAQIPDVFPDPAENGQGTGAVTYGRAYLPLELPADRFALAAEKLAAAGFTPAAECARGMFGRDTRIACLLAEKKALGVKLCMAHNLGAARLILDSGMDCIGGFGLNITNTLSLEVLRETGLTDAELSFELTAARINALGGSLPRSVIIYGHLPLMLTRTCPASLEKGCRGISLKGGNGFCSITDRLGKSFPVLCREGCSELLNTVPLSMSDKLPSFTNAERLNVRFSVEDSGKAYDVLRSILRGQPADSAAGVTRGLYFRAVQ